MSIQVSVKGRGYGFGAGIGTFDGAFQRRWKVCCGPGAGQKEIGKGCLRNRPMGPRPEGVEEKWAGLPNNVRFTGFLAMRSRKVEEILDEGPGCVKEPFIGMFLSDGFTQRDTGDYGLR